MTANHATQRCGKPEPNWNREATLAAIATYSDDTVAELFWIGRSLELNQRWGRLVMGGFRAERRRTK